MLEALQDVGASLDAIAIIFICLILASGMLLMVLAVGSSALYSHQRAFREESRKRNHM